MQSVKVPSAFTSVRKSCCQLSRHLLSALTHHA